MIRVQHDSCAFTIFVQHQERRKKTKTFQKQTTQERKITTFKCCTYKHRQKGKVSISVAETRTSTPRKWFLASLWVSLYAWWGVKFYCPCILLYRNVSQLNSFLKREQVFVNHFHFTFMLDCHKQEETVKLKQTCCVATYRNSLWCYMLIREHQ